ncbi:lactate racemase domain-containing protein [Megasphaera paucivorans]|uniref:LarA-like N-terminal domain-containing protein n=1 Tax=Megasphaera paucivorans TaxID=349095 RepID=A0A1H0BDT0_9FIRM|nr:lactate racemase domain-containing protein [Megasphaera paucivorans]SDN43761.1 protein of unknown function [Megasphaera paucivorans]
MNIIDQLLDAIVIPPMIKVKQYFPRPKIDNIDDAVRKKIIQSQVFSQVKQGQRIAITAGSRGIANMPFVLKTIISLVKQAGGVPFLVPAMGSHGGATAQGQIDVLASRGITEETMGAPIYSDIEPVKIGVSQYGFPVYFDKNAWEADWTIVVNRIKPHTNFHGLVESGLQKMIVIGLGKQKGADICHSQGFDSMAKNILDIANVALTKANILCGVALLENAYHETCEVDVVPTNKIQEQEPKLLIKAKSLCSQLYFKSFDVMIVDEIGKNISGTGFDPNILGRIFPYKIEGLPEFKRMAILDITNESHGGANGLGLSDYTTERAFHKFSPEQTYANSLTTTVTHTSKIPIVLKNDKQAIQACIKCSNRMDKENITIVRIKNTLCMNELEISANLISEIEQNKNLEVIGQPYKWTFDQDGNLRKH